MMMNPHQKTGNSIFLKKKEKKAEMIQNVCRRMGKQKWMEGSR